MEENNLAIYPIVNVKTGEKKTVEMSVHKIMDWYKENPEWTRDWSEGCATPGEVGDWQNKLVSKHPSWNTVLDRAAKMPGSNVKTI